MKPIKHLMLIGKEMNFIKSFKSKKAVPIMSLDEERFLTMDERTKDKVGNNNIFKRSGQTRALLHFTNVVA